ncbi:metallophosphoesterase family protein [Methylorubrum populi]|uniref:Calcineurin-like phosphoesterase domain-containing protein n=1 Tax=Methylorubrum populi TaxID=223967 RepID=A0A833J1B5_9HYPH|nr:hypothetical protein F8B43_5059 [Methylorubrum populi]
MSDFHFCVEARRVNLLSLAHRRPRLTLDTCLLQARDLGFLSYAKPTSYSPQVVSAAAQFCFERRLSSDGIILTGDLATTGHQLDIAVARDYAMADAVDGFVSQANRATLKASQLPLWVLPGNHDKYADNIATPRSRNFELTFGNLMPNFNKGVAHKVRRKRSEHVGIVFADFCLRERSDASNKLTGPYGQGRVHTDVLHEMESRTKYLRQKFPGITLVWAIHFAPYDCGNSLALIDWTLVAKSAVINRVTATLCGHTHVASVLKSAGHTTYCAGSAGAIDQEYSSSVHIIRLTSGSDPSVSRSNFAWDVSSGEFRQIKDD